MSTLAQTAKFNKAELKKLAKTLEKSVTTEKPVAKISNQTLEQMERAEYGFPKKLNLDKSSGGDKSFHASLKMLDKVLKRAKLRPIIEDGEYWVKILKADRSKLKAVSVSLKVPTATRKQRRTLNTISSEDITVEDWVAVGYCKTAEVFYVWYQDVDLFMCNRSGLSKLPEFIKVYFNSKYGNGLLAH